MTANDADMCATAATDAGVVTEFGGGGGGRKEEERDVRGREGEQRRREMDRGDKESTTDRTTTMNERARG